MSSTTAFRSRLLSLGLAGLFVPCLAAQDYSGGIARFRQLGLPDVKDAKYVKTTGGYNPYSNREGPKLAGSGWLLSTNTNGVSVVLVNQVTKQRRIDPKVQQKRQQKRMEEMQAKAKDGESPEFVFEDLEMMPTAKFKEVDLKKDLDTLIAHFKKPAAGKRERYSMRSQNWGGYFLLAAHAHRKGFTKEANEIIALVMQKGGGSRKVLGGAMNQLADALYQESYQTFEKEGDWQAYVQQMRDLVARFPGVWQNAPLVQRVIGEVDAHLKLTAPPPVEGENLTDEDQKLAADLAKSKKPLQYHMGRSQNWIAFGAGYGAHNTNTVMGRLQARGMKSVPLLIALLGDNYLVRTRRGESYSSYSFYDSEMFMDEEMIDQMYQHFSRPVSRGEIARGLLTPLVIKREEQRRPDRQPDDEEIKKRALKWYAANKDKSRNEMIRGYLNSDEGHEQQQAFSQLLRSEEEADRKVLEEFILGKKDVGQALGFATQFVQRHGDVVSAFAKTFIAKAKAAKSLVPADRLKYADEAAKKRYAEQAKSQLKNLEEMISGKSAEEMLADFLASKEKWTPQKWSKSSRVFWSKLRNTKENEILTMLLEGAIAAKDDTLAGFLAQGTAQVQYMRMQNSRYDPSSRPKPFKPKLDDHRELWKKLIAQDREVKTPNWGGMMGVTKFTFRKQVASIVESLYGQNQANQWQMSQSLGPRVMEIMVKRAEARLAGKPDDELPAYPDKDSVKPERREAIKQKLATIEPQKAGEYLTGLSLSELLHIADFLNEDPKLNARFAAIGNRINHVSAEIGGDEIKKTIKGLQGKTFDRKTVDQLIETGRKLVKSGQGGMLLVMRSTPLAGVTVSLDEFEQDFGMGMGTGMGNRGMINASLNGKGTEGQVYGHAMWSVEMPQPKKPKKKKEDPKKNDAAEKIKAAIASGDTEALQALLESGNEELIASALGEDAQIEMSFNNEHEVGQQEEFFEELGQVLDPKANISEPFHFTLMLTIPKPGKPGAAGLNDFEFDIVP